MSYHAILLNDVPAHLDDAQSKIVSTLVRTIGRPGSAILIFVPGLREVERLHGLLERVPKVELYVTAKRTSCGKEAF